MVEYRTSLRGMVWLEAEDADGGEWRPMLCRSGSRRHGEAWLAKQAVGQGYVCGCMRRPCSLGRSEVRDMACIGQDTWAWA